MACIEGVEQRSPHDGVVPVVGDDLSRKVMEAAEIESQW